MGRRGSKHVIGGGRSKPTAAVGNFGDCDSVFPKTKLCGLGIRTRSSTADMSDEVSRVICKRYQIFATALTLGAIADFTALWHTHGTCSLPEQHGDPSARSMRPTQHIPRSCSLYSVLTSHYPLSSDKASICCHRCLREWHFGGADSHKLALSSSYTISESYILRLYRL